MLYIDFLFYKGCPKINARFELNIKEFLKYRSITKTRCCIVQCFVFTNFKLSAIKLLSFFQACLNAKMAANSNLALILG